MTVSVRANLDGTGSVLNNGNPVITIANNGDATVNKLIVTQPITGDLVGNVTGTASNATQAVNATNATNAVTATNVSGGSASVTSLNNTGNTTLGNASADTLTINSGTNSIVKNNPAITNGSYIAGNNHIELRTTDLSHPSIGFHRGGATAITLYHDASQSLRLRDSGGLDTRITLLADFLQSFASNGYTKLPNGMIIQWGRFSTNSGHNTRINFPISFPSECTAVMVTMDAQTSPTAGIYVAAVGVKFREVAGFYGGSGTVGHTHTYISVGY